MEIDIVGLRALLQKATVPVPWVAYKFCGPQDSFYAESRVLGSEARKVFGGTKVRGADAQLIVAAVNALPSLLARIEELEAQVEGEWQDMESCPPEGEVVLYWPPLIDLPERIAVCDHRGGPFRHPTHWRPLPAPPRSMEKDR